MAEAGWYVDPVREGRLRYWDGAAWTEHVSERGGGQGRDPISGVPPAPPRSPGETTSTTRALPPLRPAGTAPLDAPAAGERYALTWLGRAGLAVAAVGGILAGAAAGKVVVEQVSLGTLVRTITLEGGAWIGIVGAVLCAAAAAAPWIWARLAGLGVAWLFGLILSFAVIGFRTDGDLIAGLDVSLDTGGWLMVIGALLFFAGTAVALVGLRRPARGPDPGARPADGKGVTALVLGIVGLVIPVTAPPAAGFGLMGMDDARLTEGRVGGRGLAIAGFVLGVVSMCLWGIGLLLGMLLAQP
jgi:hypothetical protein